jgi:hypothetical protein
VYTYQTLVSPDQHNFDHREFQIADPQVLQFPGNCMIVCRQESEQRDDGIRGTECGRPVRQRFGGDYKPSVAPDNGSDDIRVSMR